MLLFLIDGSAILYRSFYGIAPLKTSFGQPTQAILGFLRSLKKAQKNFDPTSLLVAWDSQKSERKKEYSEYKSNRQKMPEELLSQKEILEEILQKIGVAQTTEQGFEADDILFSMSSEFLRQHPTGKVIIVTADKDSLQLVSENISVFDPFKDKVFDVAAVTETFGFAPNKIMFYHSLLGDSSDNIPGVAGIGKESAKKLVGLFESLSELYARIDTVEPRLQKKLIAGRDDAFLSQSLFTLKNINYAGFSFDTAAAVALDWEAGRELFEKFELRSFLPEKSKQSLQEKFKDEIDFCENLNLKIIVTQQDLEQLILDIKRKGLFAFDLETTGLSWAEDKILGISSCLSEDQLFYIPFKQDEKNLEMFTATWLEGATALAQLAPVFEDPKILKVVHNGKFDGHFLLSVAGINIFNNTFDTAIAARLSLPEWMKVGLKSLSQSYLNLTRQSFAELAKEHGKDFANIPLDKMAKYAALDALQTFQLHKIFLGKLQAIPELLNSFQNIEMPLCPILMRMEEAGILFDLEKAERFSILVNTELERVVGKILSFVDSLNILPEQKEELKNINLNSPQQLQVLLFDVLKLSVPKKIGGGKLSTNVDVLQELALLHPVPGLILEYRRLYKLKSTYLDALVAHRSLKTGAIHTDYSQLIVSTGRLSSLAPNLQNIPKVSGNINIRDCFVARPNCSFVSADYSQIELRVLAHLTGDQQLLQAFKEDSDIHNKTACTIFSKQPEAVTPEERNLAKKINFSVLYGLSAFSLSKDLAIPPRTAQEYIDAFFATYPQVKPWMDKVVSDATKQGFITTIKGRRRWFNNLADQNQIVAKAEQRAAINAIVQGSAADIVKMAMMELDNFLSKNENQAMKTRMLLQVHDEVLLECQDPISPNLLDTVRNLMESVVAWEIPLVVNIKVGKSWGSMR